MADLNLAGESYAHSLIAAGKVDKAAPWSFEPADGNALLGSGGNDWEAYGRAHLGLNRGASEKTKGRYAYPFAKGGTLYRSGLTAIRQRAGQENDAAIYRVAGELLDVIDGTKASSSAVIECKAARFEYKFTDGNGSPAGSFEGYGSVFGNEDDNGDVILPGAFTGVLQRHQSAGTMPKMLLNHGSATSFFGSTDPMADLPIGKWNNMSEDTHGLQVKGRLINLDTERGKNIYGAMKEGTLDGLSIGYRAGDYVRGQLPNEPRRTIKSMKDLYEVSPVTFPANAAARIGSVKSLFTEREFERMLTRDAGLTRSEASIVINRGVKALLATRDAGGHGLDGLLAELRAARSSISHF